MWEIKTLLACVSKEKHRLNIANIGFKDKTWFSTDGHRLFTVNDEALPHLKGARLDDVLYHPSAFKEGMLSPEDTNIKPISTKPLFPITKHAHQFQITVPTWFGKIVSYNRVVQGIGIDEDGEFTTSKDRSLVFVNPAYLSHFAGMEVHVQIHGEKLPLIISNNTHWKYLLMPMKNTNNPRSKRV